MKSFTEFVGQDMVKRELINGLGHHVHYILRGNSGCGKTALAELTASMRGNYDVVSAKGFVLSSLHPEAVTHIIDEVHLLDDPEQIFDAMTVTPFIFCTTEGADLRETLTNRCITLTLVQYTKPELMLIGQGSYSGFNVSVLALVASRARETPRTMLQLCERITLASIDPTSYFAVKDYLDSIGVLDAGYTPNDLNYLRFLARLERASALTMASVLNIPISAITNEIEPFLLRRGKIKITGRGRMLT